MKKAFTLLELVFIIVVVGILAAVIIPNTRRDTLREAAIQLVSHIRYTQHLAMVDDKFNVNDANWYKKRWQIIFGSSTYTNGKIAYTIFSDNAASAGHSNPGLTEIARDPMSSDKYLSGGYSGTLQTNDTRANKKMNLGESYDIVNVVFGGGCLGTNKRISFDQMGRPIQGVLHNNNQSYISNQLLLNTCTLTLVDGNANNLVIEIEPETGYTHIQ